MRNGFYAEKVEKGGCVVWKVKDVVTNEVLATGNTITSAVENYENAKAFEDVEKEIDAGIGKTAE